MKRRLIVLAAAWVVAGPVRGAPSVDERKARIRALEAKQVAGEALERKMRSEATLRIEGVPLNYALPAIATEADTPRRHVDEVAWRAMALMMVAARGGGLSKDRFDGLVARYELQDRFTPDESAFLLSPAPSERARAQFSWRYEAAWVLLWALGYVDTLGKPGGVCDVPRAVSFMSERGARQFLADARLRTTGEILDEADRIYRYHWAVVEAEQRKEKMPAGLDGDVTVERHHALNWLIRYMDQDWDDITTDT